jgi:hypothetical protein
MRATNDRRPLKSSGEAEAVRTGAVVGVTNGWIDGVKEGVGRATWCVGMAAGVTGTDPAEAVDPAEW